MGIPGAERSDIETRIAAHLKQLRHDRGWSLDDLAARSGVSRSTLSRIENAEVSATAAVLGRLCSAFGVTLSRLMTLVEDAFAPVVRRNEQPVWSDPAVAFRRRAVSPPAPNLAGEALEGEIGPGCRIAYDGPPRPGLEHHLVLVDGRLSVTIEGATHQLVAGDCLRYRLYGASVFTTPPDAAARYILFMV